MRPRSIAVRCLLAAVLVSGALSHRASAQEVVKLPAPQAAGGMPVMEALAKRRSTRSFGAERLSDQQLSNLLWAAFGINRPESGGRTAPSWRGSNEIDIHVATSDGVFVYDAKAHQLRRTSTEDVRKQTSSMLFAATAPVVLVYVADRARMAKASNDEQRLYAHVDAAIIAQNVYLFAASAGLGTVILGNVDRKALSLTLKLREDQVLTFSQPVGFPK